MDLISYHLARFGRLDLIHRLGLDKRAEFDSQVGDRRLLLLLSMAKRLSRVDSI